MQRYQRLPEAGRGKTTRKRSAQYANALGMARGRSRLGEEVAVDVDNHPADRILPSGSVIPFDPPPARQHRRNRYVLSASEDRTHTALCAACAQR